MKYFTLILMFFIPWRANGQFNKLPTGQQRLLLELSSGFYNVATVGQINLDSSLIAASSYLKMSRIPVILEGFEREFNAHDITWIDKRDPRIAKKELGNLKGADHMKLLMLVGAYYAFQSGKDISDADSALVYLFKAQREAVTLRQLFWVNQVEILISKSYLKQNKVTEAESYTNLALQGSKATADLLTQAKAYFYYGTYCPFVTDLTKGRISRLASASTIYSQLNDHTGEIISYTYQSNLNIASGNFSEAKQLTLSALKLEKSIRFAFTQYSEDQVAMLDGFTMNFVEMLDYAHQAVEHSQLNKNDFGLSVFYSRLARAYGGNDYSNPETYRWLRKSIDEAIRNPGFYNGYGAIFELAAWLEEHGRSAEALPLVKRYLAVFPPRTPAEKMQADESLGDCYQFLKNLPAAEQFYKESVDLAGDPSNTSNPMSVTAFVNLGRFYTETKKYAKAKPLLLKASKRPFQPEEMKEEIVYFIATVDSALGDFPSAYADARQDAILMGKTFDKRAISERERLETKFKTKEKEQSISLLQSKSKADQAELQKIGLQRNLTLGGVLALILIAGLAYNGYRNKQRSNLLLNAQKKEIDDKNISLEKILTEKDELLFEKDLLLKEVHHRVKNNLHIVMSLLESQSAYLKDNAALGALLESQNRVQAIALIHQKLYSSDNITQVDMQSYIPELIDYLNESLSTSTQHIMINQDIEPVYLDVSQAIPVGIILNEAITNAIKYAFPKKRRGEINVSMKYSSGLVDLEISDNGVGFPAEFDFQKAHSLGMNLMKGLINQLKGTFKFDVHNGVNIRVKFSLDHISVLN